MAKRRQTKRKGVPAASGSRAAKATPRAPKAKPAPTNAKSSRAKRPRAGSPVASRQGPGHARRTTIAGVGASAGGLEAFSALLSALPDAPGLALVLVQHLAPHHESALPTLLAATTTLPVLQAVEGMKVLPNHVYVIPPNVQMGIEDDVLHLLPRPSDDSRYVPIDFFFRSLADAAQERAIGVILSGTASDGAVGIRDIKSVGGITLAQDPETAKYDGMPRAAIGTGMVDLVRPPERLAAELVEIARHPYLHPRSEAHDVDDPVVEPGPSALVNGQLQRVFKLLRVASGVDFRHYKLPTIERRLQRRMALLRITNVESYLRYLDDHPGEVQALHQDLLIHVTRFFREPESFTALAQQVFPQILESPHGDNPIRIWIAGCSSGEEVYSVAIALLESLGERANGLPMQIFATDVSEHAIEQARNATYPESIAVDVSAERLRRFFTKIDGGYRVTKTVRDHCIFARQNLVRDPPFSRLDLIVCRNVMIYMTSILQNKLLSVFHYALKPNGFLMLGNAETIGTLSELFAIEDKRHRIYRKTLHDSLLPALSFHSARLPSVVVPRRRVEIPIDHSAQHEADRIALERYAPPGVIVDDELQIVQFRGQTGLFLEPAPGDPNMSLLKMAREGLLHGVRAASLAARQSGKAVRKDGLKVKQNGHWYDVSVEFLPLSSTGRSCSLVLFHAAPQSEAPPPTARKKDRKRPKHEDDDVRRLESELATSREYLQSIVQEVEAANEELQSANEEILSSNEELQSTNEELDTAKEELQSTNEELNTLNEELHGRNAELSRANSDLVNLLASVQIPIVIVASDLRIRRFTPTAERFLNLIASDVGRPISHIKPNIDCPDLEKIVVQAIDTITPQEREVQDRQGNWLSLRVRPYRNVENRIDGAVLALVDMQQAVRANEESLPPPRGETDGVFDAVPMPLVLLDDQLRVRAANSAFCGRFGYRPDAIHNQKLLDLGNGDWKIPQLSDQLMAALNDGTTLDNRQITHHLPKVGLQKILISLQRLDGNSGSRSLLVTVADGDSAAAR